VCTVRCVPHADNVELPDATHCTMQSNPKGAAELLATSSGAIPCARDRRQRRRHSGPQGDPPAGRRTEEVDGRRLSASSQMDKGLLVDTRAAYQRSNGNKPLDKEFAVSSGYARPTSPARLSATSRAPISHRIRRCEALE
jgi:hypothetical protein